jgi:hypothetical protein
MPKTMEIRGQIPLERPRVRTREGQEVELESYGQLQQDGKLQRAVRERMVAGLSTRNSIGERWRVFWKATGSRRAA